MRDRWFPGTRIERRDLGHHIALRAIQEFVYRPGSVAERGSNRQPALIVGRPVPRGVDANDPERKSRALPLRKTRQRPADVAVSDECDSQLSLRQNCSFPIKSFRFDCSPVFCFFSPASRSRSTANWLS